MCVHCTIQLDFFFYSITNAVKTSGGLKERLFNAAYNAKRQALLHGKIYSQWLIFCITYIYIVILPDLFIISGHCSALYIDSNYTPKPWLFPYPPFVGGYKLLVFMQDSCPTPFLFLVVGWILFSTIVAYLFS